MIRNLVCICLLLALFGIAMPAKSLAQNRRDESNAGKFIKRGKNGIRFGDRAITLFDGPGIVNYHYKHRWMEGPAGAATVIGAGAGAGALTGGIVKGKKGAVVGALVGAGAATGIWLYKNRTEKRRIF